MLVCSCNRIDHRGIEAEVDRQLDADPMLFLTATCIYMALGERPRCGVCLPLAADIINSRTETIRRRACEAGGPRKQQGAKA